MIVSTHQPNYIPWMGYFYKISKSDIFVFLDDVQFSKTGSHNYHNIKMLNGLLRLKIPVKHKFIDPINKVITKDEGGWKKRHLDLIRENYSNAPYFDEVFFEFENVLNMSSNNLAELNIRIIHFFMQKFKIKTKTVKTSELELNESLRGEQRIIEICKKVKASTYYSGKGAKDYQEESNFNNQGINLVYDKFQPIEYNQLWGNFIKNVSVLDFVFNNGYDWDNYKTKVDNNIL